MLLGHAITVTKINNKIEVLIRKTEEHQRNCIKNLRKVLKRDRLVGDDDLAYWTYLHCSKRQYFLFDPDGAAIEERSYLKDVISKYIDYKKIKGKLYFQEFVVSF